MATADPLSCAKGMESVQTTIVYYVLGCRFDVSFWRRPRHLEKRFGGGSGMRSDFAFHYAHRVRWVECDPQWVVFNGHYLTYFDVAITEYARAVGLPGVVSQQQSGQQFFARKATIEYHAPAQYDNELDIGVRLAALGRSSARFILEIYRDETLLTSGELIYVFFDSKAGVSLPIPESQRQAVRDFERTAVLEQSSNAPGDM